MNWDSQDLEGKAKRLLAVPTLSKKLCSYAEPAPIIEAIHKKTSPIELVFQKSDLGLAEYLFQTRERDLVF